MNILMVTNTYLPHVGGVAGSVAAFTEAYRERGHRVVVVAPTFEGMAEHETDVVRVPAIQNFNGSDFSVQLPVPPIIFEPLDSFEPDVVHSHHPFLLGASALRIAAIRNAPLVFTHHTMYERYTHYVPGDSPQLKKLAVDLSTGYANLAQLVFAPSESVRDVLLQRGVVTPVEVVPTGVDIQLFGRGDGAALRRECGIPESAFLAGHVGRLAEEKNLVFLARSVRRFLEWHGDSHFVVVGTGPSQREMESILSHSVAGKRVHFIGAQSGEELAAAYRAMNVFVFASHTETQGLVLAEAMAAGVPVVALDAPGVREVVSDRENGRLIEGDNTFEFADAVAWVHDRGDREREELIRNAEKTAERFSRASCADRALALYEQVRQTVQWPSSLDDSAWGAAVRLIETEWNLTMNTAEAVSRLLFRSRLWSSRPVVLVRSIVRRIRRAINRSEWAIRLLRLKTFDGRGTEPGLVLIQIDGLAHREFERALAGKRMKFLSSLLRDDGYEVHHLYSGLPSTTPAAQGELFYGVRGAVPAFHYFDPESGSLRTMFEPASALAVEEQLRSRGKGLLTGGSCYSSIYTGGAAEPHFCPAAFGWGSLVQAANPLSIGVFLLWQSAVVVKTAALALLEVGLAVFDCIRGVLSGEDLRRELKFVLSRVSVCVLLREVITTGAVIDVTRGLRSVHVNFLGYDEQAHRRGPSSRFAHWTLKGIDRSIERICKAARRSRRRDYVFIVYSDHGQETVRSFEIEHRKSLQEAVAEALDRKAARVQAPPSPAIQAQRAEWLGGKVLQLILGIHPPKGTAPVEEGDVLVTGMGPLGHVYFPRHGAPEERERLARTLAEKYEIPFVTFRRDGGGIGVATGARTGELSALSEELLGSTHPYLKETAHDLEELAKHPASGDLICFGWRPKGKPFSFPVENGAHAGPGRDETSAFALLPAGAAETHDVASALRHSDLRRIGLSLLGESPPVRRSASRKRATRKIRIMSYNVHSCIGMDGKHSPERIARLLRRYHPDMVALQELDVGRLRTDLSHQAHVIAEELGMDLHFHAALSAEGELYGNAILSALPMKLVRAGALPTLPGVQLEPRGAVLISLQIDGQEVRVLNTHLGLHRGERKLQVRALLQQEWIGSRSPIVVCGDLNDVPGSWCYNEFHRKLKDAQERPLNGTRRKANTWPSRFPFRRIDYVFVSSGFRVAHAEVPRTPLTKVASDHLPLLVDLELPEE